MADVWETVTVASHDAETENAETRSLSNAEQAVAIADPPVHASSLSKTTAKPMKGMVLGGRYTLEAPIERGSWGEVWRANHEVLRKTFAVKILHRRSDDDDWAEKRMLREARAVSQISHPAVVEVVDFGHVDETPYIVMEYLVGHSLQAELRKGAMAWPRARALLLQAIEGLAAAHAQGIIHRDIKPSNLFLVSDGRGLKVIDFGIAGRNARLTRITEAGEVLGTPHYMSPEQTRGVDVTAASDVYSLGCVAYAMLCGRPPYVGSTPEIIRQHIKEPPRSFVDAACEIPQHDREVLDRCLLKAPADRFASMAELYKALTGSNLDGAGVRTSKRTALGRLASERAERSDKRGMMLAGFVAAAFAVGGLGALYFATSSRSVDETVTDGVVAPAAAPVASPKPAQPPAPRPVSPVSVGAPPPPIELALPVETAVSKPSVVEESEGAAPDATRPRNKARPRRGRDSGTAEPEVAPEPEPEAAAEPVKPRDEPPIKRVGGLKNPFEG